jgi:prolyl oligopeptidase
MYERHHLSWLPILALLACSATPSADTRPPGPVASIGPAPVARTEDVRTVYHGVEVVEQYRWLEDWNDPEVREWSAAQNAHARTYLSARPHREDIRSRVRAVIGHESPSFWGLEPRPTGLFAMQAQPPKQQPFLVLLESADAPESARALVDPNVIAADGSISIDWFVPSPDGALVAVSLSRSGSERGDLHVFDVATGERVDEIIEHVNGGTAGGTLAWLPDGSGFFYSRYPRDGSRPDADLDFYVQVYFHALGTAPAEDRHEIGRDFPKAAEIELIMDRRTGYLLATVQDGDGGEFAHFLRSPQGGWRQFSHFGDRIVQAAFGPRRDLYLLSRANAPRGEIRNVAIDDLDVTNAKRVIPEGADSIVSSFWHKPSVLATDTRLFALYQLGGPSQIRVFDLSGQPLGAPRQLDVSSAGGMTPISGDSIYFSNTSYVKPWAWYRFDGATGTTIPTWLADVTLLDLSSVQVRREFAVSRDGTLVPVNILIPPDTPLDGSAAAVVTGYGGYGVSISPWYSRNLGLLLEQGVIVAVANLRGGGEYGDEWHRQGNLTKKQNVFDDFAAVLDHMTQRKYTSVERLLIQGGSNGGLLMGATLVQHPNRMKAVVAYVGIYDMLRVELSPNGEFNITEFGTVKDPDQFRALYDYSPYHNAVDGTRYPPVLFVTGANDPRVDPMQSRKMTARLQAANSGGGPILLRTSSTSGHGGSKALDERIDEMVDVYAFIFDQLGVAYRAPAD